MERDKEFIPRDADLRQLARDARVEPLLDGPTVLSIDEDLNVDHLLAIYGSARAGVGRVKDKLSGRVDRHDLKVVFIGYFVECVDNCRVEPVCDRNPVPIRHGLIEIDPNEWYECLLSGKTNEWHSRRSRRCCRANPVQSARARLGTSSAPMLSSQFERCNTGSIAFCDSQPFLFATPRSILIVGSARCLSLPARARLDGSRLSRL